MEISWKRYKTTAEYTLSRISYKNIFTLDVIEPPVEGLSTQPLSTMSPGIYKLFLKTDLVTCEAIPRIQKIAGKPFFFVAPCKEVTDLLHVKHGISTLAGFQFKFYAGKVQGVSITPDEVSFDKLKTCLIYAIKNGETVKINVS